MRSISQSVILVATATMLVIGRPAAAQTKIAPEGWPSQPAATKAVPETPKPAQAGKDGTPAGAPKATTPPPTAKTPAPATATKTSAPATSTTAPTMAELVQALEHQSAVLARLSAQMETQDAMIASQQTALQRLQSAPDRASSPGLTNAATTAATTSKGSAVAAAPAAAAPAPTPARAGQASSSSTPTSPLAIHVGDADLLIGGFMDATSVTRSVTTGNGLGTSFGTIPFLTPSSSTANLPETRLSTQNSRLTLMATSKVGHVAIKGYMEGDFLGNAPTNLVVTSNANTLRMRLFWVQAMTKKLEFTAGQSWSLMTPGRNGISPSPGDIFFSQDVDTNYQSGLVWGRTTSYRLVAHPSKAVSAGVSFENPEQYVGSAVTLPAKFASAEVDNGSNSAAPNRYPDIIGKVAFDPTTGKTHQHIEFSGLFRGFKTYDTTAFTTHTATGKGGSLNVNLEPVKNLHLVFNSFFSKGGGRYIANTNIPDFIVNADSSLTLVTAHSLMGGVEVQAAPKTLIYGYYSDVKANQAVAFDQNGTTPIGFGITGAASANNEVTESTGGLTQTFFKDAKIGGMQLMAQFSFVKRTPFSVPTGTPATATAKMFFLNIRYILP